MGDKGARRQGNKETIRRFADALIRLLPLVFLLRSSGAGLIYLALACGWSGVAQEEAGQAAGFWLLILPTIGRLVYLIRTQRHAPETLLNVWGMLFALCIATGLTLERTVPGLWIVAYAALLSGAGLIGMHLYGERDGWSNPPKSFGYVENYTYQTLKIMEAPAETIQGEVFYLSDYDEFTIRAWADAIAAATGGGIIRTVPAWTIRLLARVGDLCKILGWKSVPISSFRLRNMWLDTTHLPLDNIQALTGPLPFTMTDGVKRTVEWMRREGLLA